MKILVTAGNTQMPIDHVRAITNIFHGRTGSLIAQHMADMGADVTLITSNKDLVSHRNDIHVVGYRTYDCLAMILADHVQRHQYDVIIHSAAVSDYAVSGIYAKSAEGELVEISADAKISSRHRNLYLELSPTEKLVDKFRKQWGFTGLLVKFKLEVDRSREELIEIATKSMYDSQADMIVANCLEWSSSAAVIITAQRTCMHISRNELAQTLWRMINV